MFYLTVLLPSVIAILSYYILLLIRVKKGDGALKALISFIIFSVSVAIVIVAIKLAFDNFSSVDFLAILLLYLAVFTALISFFLQLKIFARKKVALNVTSSINRYSAGRLTNIAKGALKIVNCQKSGEDLTANNLSDGLVLDNRTAQNATVEEIDVTALEELFNRASKSKNAYKHKKILSLAKKTIEDFKSGKVVKTNVVESAIDGLIKILSRENFEI